MYISVRFFSEYPRDYTYICKRTIKVDDFVVVPTTTKKTVARVTAINVPTPSFQCKEIIKRVRL